VNVVVNGEERNIAAGVTVAELVEDVLPGRRRGVAVAVDAEVVPRSAWERTMLAEGQRVELLAAMQGG
jgi:sulfur carrier protein